jgi:hypothetical protein
MSDKIKTSGIKKTFLIMAPLVLMLTVYLVLTPLVDKFGLSRGLLYGYFFYWGFWCIIFPLWVVGLEGFKKMFAPSAKNLGKMGWLLLALPVIIYPVYLLPEIWHELTITVVLLSLPVALVNGTLEELLWRGTYVTAFPGKLFPGYLFPSIAFGVWHVAPYAVIPEFSAAGAVMVTLGGTLFGLCWGWAAWKCGSIRLPVLSHVLANFLAMGAISFIG